MERHEEERFSEEEGYLGTWSEDGFLLRLFDTGRSSEHGKPRLRYTLVDDRFDSLPLFEGDDFSASPMHAVDSPETVASLLGFLSLKPGDTDADYFAGYSARQRDWLETGRPDELQIIVFDMENPPAELGADAGPAGVDL